MKICSKTHQITPFIFFSMRACPRSPLANACMATSRVASRSLRGMQLAQPPKTLPWVAAPLVNPAYAHGFI